VNDASQSREFNAEAIKWLQTLEPHFLWRSASGIKKSQLEVASGARVVSLLWLLSTYVLDGVMRRDCGGAACVTGFTLPPPLTAVSDKVPAKLIPHMIHAAQVQTVQTARAFVRHSEQAAQCQQQWAQHAQQLMAERKQLEQQLVNHKTNMCQRMPCNDFDFG
jgi:hypothetical protein